jgi:hypothetical protein
MVWGEGFYKGAEVTEWECGLWFLKAMEPAKFIIFNYHNCTIIP